MARTSPATLARRAAEQAELDRANAARRAAEEIERDRVAAERQARAAERGSAKEFSERLFESERAEWFAANPEEKWLANATAMAIYAVKQRAEAVAKFAADFAENPDYALRWSDSVFSAVAKGDVALQFVVAVERGCSAAEIKEEFARQLGYVAGSMTSQSTSSGDNTMARAKCEALHSATKGFGW